MSGGFDVKTYRPAGDTIRQFHESSKFIRLMAGPVGSGKTAGAGCVEMTLGGMVQEPFPDGVRRAKFGVLRDTYRNLYSQFIPSWFEWYPRELGKFVGSDDRPAMHVLPLETPLGPCEIQIEMRALGTNSVEATCRGWNLTGCFIDEADLIPQEAIGFLTGRVKRWPQKPFRVSKGIWATFNKPDEDHWLYQMCVEDPPPDCQFFDQPPGLLPDGSINPNAENLDRLDDDYYQLQVANNSHVPGYEKRMVRNEWGTSRSGQLIYSEFVRAVHVSPIELQPLPGSDLWVGLDGGGTPAAVIGGRDRWGRIIIYAEVVLTDPLDPRGRKLRRQVGGKRFGEALRDTLKTRFPQCRVRVGYGDPSSWYGIDREMGELSHMEIAGQTAGIALTPAESNEVALRLEAVRQPLSHMTDGQPDLMVNPSCRFLIRGFISDYRWQEAEKKGEGETLKPQKTVTSHVHDAAQYLCLGMIGRAALISGMKHDRWRPTPGGVLIPNRAGPSQAYDTPGFGQAVVKGSHYKVDFNLWR